MSNGHWLRSPFASYPLALITVAAVTALMLWAQSRVEVANLSLLYLVVVLFVAITLGTGPGVLAAVTSVLAAFLLSIAPARTFSLGGLDQALLLFMIAALSLLIVYLVSTERRQRERVEATAPGERAARQELEALQAITEAGLTTLDPDELLHTLLKRLVQGTKADGGSILLLDDSGQYLETRASYGCCTGAWAEQRIRLGEDFAGRIALEEKPASVLRTPDQAAFRARNPAVEQPVSYLGVPLKLHGKVIGVAQIATVKTRQFTPREVRILEVMADRAVATVERAKLFEESKQNLSIAKSIIEDSPAAVAIVQGPDLRIVMANRSSHSLFGVSETPIGRSLRELLPECANDLARELSGLGDGAPDGGVTLDIRAGGRAAGWRLTCTPLPGRSPSDSKLLMMGTTVSGRCQDQSGAGDPVPEADAKARQLRTILDNVHDAVFVADARGNLVEVNRAALQMMGITSELNGEMPSAPLIDLLDIRTADGDPLSPFDNPVARVLMGQLLEESEYIIRQPGSCEDRFVSLSAAPVRDNGDEVVLAVGVARDITERRRREEELAAVSRVAARLVQSIGLEETLNSVVELTSEVLGADSAVLMLITPGQDQLQLVAHRNCRPAVLDLQRELSLDSPSLIAEAVRTKRIRVIEDAGQIPPSLSLAKKLFEAGGYRSAVAAPLLFEGRPVGAIAYNPPQPRHFSGADLRIIGIVTNLFAMAVENANLYKQVRHHGEFLERIVENIPALVLVYDAETLRLRHANGHFRTRLAEEERAGEVDIATISDLRALADSEGLSDALEKVLDTGTSYSLNDFQFHLLPSGPTYFSWNLVPLHDAGGHLETLILIAVETTEQVAARRRLEEMAGEAQDMALLLQGTNQELVENTLRLQAIIDNMPEGVIIADSVGQIFTGNKKAAEILGAAELIGPRGDLQPAYSDFDAKGYPILSEDHPLMRAIATGETYIGEEVRIRRLSGEEVTILLNTTPLKDAGGRISGAVSIFQDITKMKELDQLKDEFMSIASHEMKTPLTSIKGYTQLVLKRAAQVPEDRRGDTQFLRIIDGQVDRITALVNDLLDVSRIQLGKFELHRGEVRLGEMIRRTIGAVQSTTDRHEVVYEGPETEVSANWDGERIEEVIGNLLTNAIKYSPDGGRVEVRSTLEDGWVRISVQDWGMGIPADSQDHLFQRFFRASNVSVRSFGGLGIGLYISKEIIERHGGQIWAESREGEGSTFTFRLPLRAPEAAEG